MDFVPNINIKVPNDLNYFALRFDNSNKFRLVAATKDIFDKTKEKVLLFWSIEHIYEFSGCVEFKIEGAPFIPSKKLDARVKLFLCSLFKEYYAMGWHLKFSTDLKLSGCHSDVVIFERSNCISTFVICLSLNDIDKLRAIVPNSLVAVIRAAVMKYWSIGIKEENTVGPSFEFRLNGAPWGPWIDADIGSSSTISLINGLLSTLYQHGWVFTAAICSGNRESDLKSLYFKYDQSETQNPVNLNSRFFGMSLNKNERIRLIGATPELITPLRSVMPKFWPKGIAKEKNLNNVYEFKLNGNPWNCDEEERVDANRLIGCIFSFFSQYSWNLYATCTLTISSSDKSTFFFRSSEPKRIEPINTICISLDSFNKIKVIDGNQSILNTIRSCIMQSWPFGIQKESERSEQSWEFKLIGNPFNGCVSSEIYACYMMIKILSGIESQGMRLISSADLNGACTVESPTSPKNEYSASGLLFQSCPVDLDSWFFAIKSQILYED